MDGEEVPETQEDVENGVDGVSAPADEHAPLQLVYVGEERPRSVPEVILLHPPGAPTGSTVGRKKGSHLHLLDEHRGNYNQLISGEHARLDVIERADGVYQLKVTNLGRQGSHTPDRAVHVRSAPRGR